MDIQELQDFYRGKTVLVTGHTGFKGSWLSHVLLHLGARVVGVSLPPQTPNDIFVRTGLESRLTHYEFDIRKGDALRALMAAERPDVVFHLAAQPLVRRSYDEPLLTVSTNVGGTANVLEAIRMNPSVRAGVIITTDKVYENKEWLYGYRENDPLGGYDPYSGSKAAADIVTQAYVQSFFNPKFYGTRHNTLVAVARAGNVIGGGDWSPDRLVPDIMRAILYGDGTVTLRNPDAVRPWEHVLEPISGYLLLGMQLGKGETFAASTWNFGPGTDAWLSVGDVTEKIMRILGKGKLVLEPDETKHEAGLLTLDTTKAARLLGWYSRWNSEQTLQNTAQWYRVVAAHPEQAREITETQVVDYFAKKSLI